MILWYNSGSEPLLSYSNALPLKLSLILIIYKIDGKVES